MLEIRKAGIGYDSKIIFSDVDFLLEEGKLGCITGQSGRGKTSLLRAILGFVPLLSGEILLNGSALTPQSAETLRKDMAYVPQELALPAEWVKEMADIPFLLKANKKLHSRMEKELPQVLESLGLEDDILQKRAREISGGQRQRVMLAISVLLGKKLILVDEPTSALDADACGKVLNLFRTTCKQGTMVLAVTHDPEFAHSCDKILQID